MWWFVGGGKSPLSIGISETTWVLNKEEVSKKRLVGEDMSCWAIETNNGVIL